MRTRVRLAALAVVGAATATGLSAPAQADVRPIVIWAPADRAAALTAGLPDGFRGVRISVVAKSAADLRAELSSVPLADAPDLIWAENSWTGGLVNDGLVDPIPLSEALRAQFPANVLDGFRYGFDFYGLPVAVRSIALVTNADLVPGPVTTFRQLERRALDLVKRGRARVPLAVGQGARGSAVMLGPLFTGLGGYLFGRNAAGSLDPYNVGIAGPDLLAQAEVIDRWGAEGLIDTQLTAGQAQRAFTDGRAPFWITGPWSAGTLAALPFPIRVSAVPPIVDGLEPVPFLGIEGLMLTSYAASRGTADTALALVRGHVGDPGVQSGLASAMRAAPARTDAVAAPIITDFRGAGQHGVAMPNIPQAAPAWEELGNAWLTSLRMDRAVPARTAFTTAQRRVLAAVG